MFSIQYILESKFFNIAFFFCMGFASVSHSLEAFADEGMGEQQEPLFLYDLPLLDMPVNRHDGTPWRNPSMAQSLNISRSLYHGVHAGLQSIVDPYDENFWKRLGGVLLIIGTDAFVTGEMPGFTAWQHEEWHRAVMNKRHVSSYNDVYKWPHTETGEGVINVSHVSDASLARMKRESNADFVRLQEAGIEASWELNHGFAKDRFFSHTRTYNEPLMLLNNLGNTGYLLLCTSDNARESDKTIDDSNSIEGANIAARDFTGLDFLGWIYDLNRPSEPYEARGRHPSGVGINRYRRISDLTNEERKFLNGQAYLSYFNFVDPLLYGFTRFSATNPWTGSPFFWNIHAQHTLTSFGGDTAVGFFYQDENLNLAGLLHIYKNKQTYFPGLEVEIPQQTFANLGSAWAFSPRFMLWTQPKDLLFRASTHEIGGLLGVRTEYRAKNWLSPYLEVEVKSQGWVAGVVAQEKNLAVRLGMSGSF